MSDREMDRPAGAPRTRRNLSAVRRLEDCKAHQWSFGRELRQNWRGWMGSFAFHLMIVAVLAAVTWSIVSDKPIYQVISNELDTNDELSTDPAEVAGTQDTRRHKFGARSVDPAEEVAHRQQLHVPQRPGEKQPRKDQRESGCEGIQQCAADAFGSSGFGGSQTRRGSEPCGDQRAPRQPQWKFATGNDVVFFRRDAPTGVDAQSKDAQQVAGKNGSQWRVQVRSFRP